jgi:hypothetical protein
MKLGIDIGLVAPRIEFCAFNRAGIVYSENMSNR